MEEETQVETITKAEELDVEIPMDTPAPVREKKLQEFTATVKDLGEGVIEAIVASDKLDRHGEVLDIKGLDLSEYKKNPIVAWMHNYNEPPVGQTLSLKKTSDGKLVAKMQFAINEYPFAHQIYKLYKGGYMRAFSIGFIPEEMDENRYTKSKMLEYSAVLIPANAEALTLAKQKGFEVDLVAKSAGIELSSGGGEDEMNENNEEVADQAEETVEETKTETPAQTPAADTQQVEKQISELKKTIETLADSVKSIDKAVVKNVSTFSVSKNLEDTPKEEKFKLYYQGLVSKNFNNYLNVVGKAAMNTTDHEEVLPPEEFIAEVSRLEEQYGVASRFARVRRSEAPTLRGLKGGNEDFTFTKTDESGVKPSKRISYDEYTLTYDKYTGIIPVTDELLEDSAIDLWNDITNRIARAAALTEDQLVFTDSTKGLVKDGGVADVTVTGDSIEDITFDDLNEMVYAVPTPSMQNGRFYLHRTVLGVIQRIKDKNDNYIWQPGVNGPVDGTIWGFPYTLTEVLNGVTADGAEKPFIVFGDLKNTILGIRVPLQLKHFDSGSVVDPENGAESLNLLTQDIQAIRARLRLNTVHVHPEAYSVLSTGPAAS